MHFYGALLCASKHVLLFTSEQLLLIFVRTVQAFGQVTSCSPWKYTEELRQSIWIWSSLLEFRWNLVRVPHGEPDGSMDGWPSIRRKAVGPLWKTGGGTSVGPLPGGGTCPSDWPPAQDTQPYGVNDHLSPGISCSPMTLSATSSWFRAPGSPSQTSTAPWPSTGTDSPFKKV